MIHDHEVENKVRREVIQQIDEITKRFKLDEWTLIMFKADGSYYKVISNFTDILSTDIFRVVLLELLKQSQTLLHDQKYHQCN